MNEEENFLIMEIEASKRVFESGKLPARGSVSDNERSIVYQQLYNGELRDVMREAKERDSSLIRTVEKGEGKNGREEKE